MFALSKDDLIHERSKIPMSELDLLLENAQLRDQLEPYLDESVYLVDLDSMPTDRENEYLQSLLAWETAPIRPIAQWFEPELVMPHPETLSDEELHQTLHQTIGRLFEKNIALHFTDHLSDRQLYCLIMRDILPSPEKQVELPKSLLNWRCLDEKRDEEYWLRHYASDEDRNMWAFETGLRLPPKEVPQFRRQLPR